MQPAPQLSTGVTVSAWQSAEGSHGGNAPEGSPSLSENAKEAQSLKIPLPSGNPNNSVNPVQVWGAVGFLLWLAGMGVMLLCGGVQNKMFEALGMSDCEINEKFGFFVEALKYGTPPHGGIAFGLDRIVMFLANVIDIKDVMAFPKNKKAECLLSNAPSRVGDIQLHELGIYIKE